MASGLPIPKGLGGLLTQFRQGLANGPWDWEELDKVLDGVSKVGLTGDFVPALDLVEKDGQWIVTAEVPGVSADDIDISVNDGYLVISGQKRQKEEEIEGKPPYSERCFGSFQRVLFLSSNVDTETIEATLKDGILEVCLSKVGSGSDKKIEIKTE